MYRNIFVKWQENSEISKGKEGEQNDGQGIYVPGD
jgi:hypothetical protein